MTDAPVLDGQCRRADVPGVAADPGLIHLSFFGQGRPVLGVVMTGR